MDGFAYRLRPAMSRGIAFQAIRIDVRGNLTACADVETIGLSL